MKFLALAAVVALGALIAYKCRRTLHLRPLVAENGGDLGALRENLGALTLNLNGVLNAIDSPGEYSWLDVRFARASLAEQSALAEAYIPKADAALKRSDLPRDLDKVGVYFPRFDLTQSGDPDAAVRKLATARAQVLACQASLLNLRTSKKDVSADRANYEQQLVAARQALAAAEKGR